MSCSCRYLPSYPQRVWYIDCWHGGIFDYLASSCLLLFLCGGQYALGVVFVFINDGINF